MDYEIKARLAQVSPTMAANVLHNLCLSRRGKAGRIEVYGRRKKKTDQSIHQQTIPTNPAFAFMIILPWRSFSTFLLMVGATSKANLY